MLFGGKKARKEIDYHYTMTCSSNKDNKNQRTLAKIRYTSPSLSVYPEISYKVFALLQRVLILGALARKVAAHEGHTQVVKLLLADARVNPNAGSDTGATPLAAAAQQVHCDMVEGECLSFGRQC